MIQDSKTYFPLNEETRWEYSAKVVLPGGDVSNRKMITRVDGKKKIDGKQYFKAVEFLSDTDSGEISYYRAAPQGL